MNINTKIDNKPIYQTQDSKIEIEIDACYDYLIVLAFDGVVVPLVEVDVAGRRTRIGGPWWSPGAR